MKRIPYLFLLIILIFKTVEIYAQWVWQNPKPTGVDLLNVKFYNSSIGWIVGSNGTILKTTNGGQKWFTLNGDPMLDYYRLFTASGESLWVTTVSWNKSNFDYPRILLSTDGGINWIEKFNGTILINDTVYPPCGRLLDIDFPDKMNGYVVGNSGVILKTTDGGSTWNISRYDTNYSIETVQFLDSLNGFIGAGGGCVYDPTCPSTTWGYLARTTDGGITWQKMFADSVSIHDIFFLNRELGWAVGGYFDRDTYVRHNFVFKTTDGGVYWSRDSMNATKSIYFTDEYHGWAVGFNGVVAKTNNGGLTWTESYPHGYNKNFMSVYFTDSLQGVAVGFVDGAIIQTTDGGINWTNYDTSYTNSNINFVHFLNPDTGWIYMNGLLRTTDKGEHWQDQAISSISAMDCSGGNCWGVGSLGKIIRTTDAGITWSGQTSGVTISLKDVKFIDENMGWTVGGGMILKTTNGGTDWITKRSDPVSSGFYKITLQDTTKVWIYGAQSNLHTTDGGKTWLGLDSMWALFFLNPDTGWMVINNNVCRTYDGGKSYEILGKGTGSINTQFTDANNGWFSFLNGTSRTHNGGSSWKPDLTMNYYRWLYGFHFTDSLHGWAVGPFGTLIRYGYPELATGVYESHDVWSIPKEFHLEQNFPNPFNSSTTIRYSINFKSSIIIKISDILGREVKTLGNEEKYPGNYSLIWDGTDNNGNNLSSGFYICRLIMTSQNRSFFETKKILLIK